jgi:predicted  nucleic acid-binding Zn-ribbon protein
MRVAYYLVIEMLEVNSERLDGLNEQSTLAHLDQVSHATTELAEGHATLLGELDVLRRQIQRNERVIAQYANAHGEQIDSLKDFEEKMTPISDMLAEAKSEIEAETLLFRGCKMVFAPVERVASILLNPLGAVFPTLDSWLWWMR